eukprot:scaffold10666_cov58-Attheya_sp.AAC.1
MANSLFWMSRSRPLRVSNPLGWWVLLLSVLLQIVASSSSPGAEQSTTTSTRNLVELLRRRRRRGGRRRFGRSRFGRQRAQPAMSEPTSEQKALIVEEDEIVEELMEQFEYIIELQGPERELYDLEQAYLAAAFNESYSLIRDNPTIVEVEIVSQEVVTPEEEDTASRTRFLLRRGSPYYESPEEAPPRSRLLGRRSLIARFRGISLCRRCPRKRIRDPLFESRTKRRFLADEDADSDSSSEGITGLAGVDSSLFLQAFETIVVSGPESLVNTGKILQNITEISPKVEFVDLTTDSPTSGPTKSTSPTEAPTGVSEALTDTDGLNSGPEALTDASSSGPPTKAPTTTDGPTNLSTEDSPTVGPTNVPSDSPTKAPTDSPTRLPTVGPSTAPTPKPTDDPTDGPKDLPTSSPKSSPTLEPTRTPTVGPSQGPTPTPTYGRTDSPTSSPTSEPTSTPTVGPSAAPTPKPTYSPTDGPTDVPTYSPTSSPTVEPTRSPSNGPSVAPTTNPTDGPTDSPTDLPTSSPTSKPTSIPTNGPSAGPSPKPTDGPTDGPTDLPTASPTSEPTSNPTVGPFAGTTPQATYGPIDEYASGEGAGNSVELIYGDFLGAAWTDYSYNGNYHYDERSEVYEGNHAIRADYNGWGGLQVEDIKGLNSEGIMSLSFFIKVTGTSTDPILVWVDDQEQIINPKNNEWEHVVLPLSQLESPSKISKIVFENGSGEGRTVYFDRIEFISDPTVGPFYAGTTMMATDGPTDEYAIGEVAGNNSVELIYGDFLGDKWTDYSYNGTYHYDERSEVYEGNHAIRADYNGWGGLLLGGNNDLNLEGITSLSFFIKVTGTSTDPILVWVDDQEQIINPKNNEWEHLVLPLSQFESPSKISRVVFENYSGEARTVYFDRIEFI